MDEFSWYQMDLSLEFSVEIEQIRVLSKEYKTKEDESKKLISNLYFFHCIHI